MLAQPLGSDHAVSFTLAADLAPLVDFSFGAARSHRATGTVSYDVTLTNTADQPIVLPVLLTLDPALGYPGVPVAAAGQTEDGKWLIELSDGLDNVPWSNIWHGRDIASSVPDVARIRNRGSSDN